MCPAAQLTDVGAPLPTATPGLETLPSHLAGHLDPLPRAVDIRDRGTKDSARVRPRGHARREASRERHHAGVESDGGS